MNDTRKEVVEMMLTKEQILGVVDTVVEKVNVPAWKGCVYIKTMTGAERDLFEQRIHDQKKNEKINIKGVRSFLLALTICDASGKNIFSKEDMDEIDKKSAKVITDLFKVAQRMNGIGEEEMADLAKKLESAPKEENGSN